MEKLENLFSGFGINAIIEVLTRLSCLVPYFFALPLVFIN